MELIKSEAKLQSRRVFERRTYQCVKCRHTQTYTMGTAG